MRDAANVVDLFCTFQTDPVNHQPISVEAVKAAQDVVVAFSNIVAAKAIRIAGNKLIDEGTKALARAANTTIQGIKNAASKTGDAINETIKQGARAVTPTLP